MDFNNINGYLAEEDDITKMDAKLKGEGKQGIIFDPTGMNNCTPPPINLPDVGSVLDKIAAILEYMCNDDIILLKKNDENEYIKHMEEQFPAFSDRYYSLFQKVISGDDLTHLFSMLGAIERIKSGETTVDKAEKELGDELANDYVYPVTGLNDTCYP